MMSTSLAVRDSPSVRPPGEAEQAEHHAAGGGPQR